MPRKTGKQIPNFRATPLDGSSAIPEKKMDNDGYDLEHLFCGISENVLMPVTVEMHNAGNPELQRDILAMIEHVLSDRQGEWRVSIIGSQASDQWEMKIFGPNAFERFYMLEGSAGQHEPRAIASIVSKMVPKNPS